MGQARLQRNGGYLPAMGGDVAVRIDRMKPRQPLPRLGQSRRGRRIEKGQAAWIVFAPQQAGQQQAAEVRFQNLGRIMGWQ
jgi:hypothetical protein